MKARIDLHLHTRASKFHENSIEWESTHFAISKLNSFGIKIFSFTDHNIFDLKLYKKAKRIAQTGNLLVLPGIEVNVVRKNGKIGNIIYIFSDELSDEQLIKIEEIAKKNIPTRGISLENANLIFADFDHLCIPHVGKADFLELDDLLMINYDAIEITSEDHHNYKKAIKGIDPTSVVSFSDTHIWRKYPQQGKLITEIEINELSYNQLKKKINEKQKYFRKVF
ncbi:MAG: PHP domain-containing protein [Metamycoplasmataceae bacterium]